MKGLLVSKRNESIKKIEEYKSNSTKEIDDLIQRLTDRKSELDKDTKSVKNKLKKMDIEPHLDKLKDDTISNLVKYYVYDNNKYYGEDDYSYRDVGQMTHFIEGRSEWNYKNYYGGEVDGYRIREGIQTIRNCI